MYFRFVALVSMDFYTNTFTWLYYLYRIRPYYIIIRNITYKLWHILFLHIMLQIFKRKCVIMQKTESLKHITKYHCVRIDKDITVVMLNSNFIECKAQKQDICDGCYLNNLTNRDVKNNAV